MTERGDLLFIDSESIKVTEKGQYQRLKERVLAQLGEFHQRFPMKSGLSKEELRTKLPLEVDVKLFQILMNELIQLKEVVLEKDKIRLPTHRISSIDEKGLVKRVEGAVLKGGLQPPSPKELSEEWSKGKKRFEPFLNILFMKAYWLRLKVKYIFIRSPFEKLKGGIGELLEGASRDHHLSI